MIAKNDCSVIEQIFKMIKSFPESSSLQFQPVWYQSCTEASKESFSG